MTEREIIQEELRRLYKGIDSLYRNWQEAPPVEDVHDAYRRMVDSLEAQINALERKLADLKEVPGAP